MLRRIIKRRVRQPQYLFSDIHVGGRWFCLCSFTLLILMTTLVHAKTVAYEDWIQQARQGLYAPALQGLQQYQREHSDDLRVQLDLIRVHYWAGNATEVLEGYQRLPRLAPQPTRTLAERFVLADRAVQLQDDILKNSDTSLASSLFLQRVHGDRLIAVDVREEIVPNVDISHQRANQYPRYALGALAPNNVNLRVSLADAQRMSNLPRHAEHNLKIAETSSPRQEDVIISQAKTALDLQEYITTGALRCWPVT